MRHDESSTAHAGRIATAGGEAAEQRLQRRIGAFPTSSRAAVDRLARLAPAFEDLADSFPALLFALATGYGSDVARNETLVAVAQGRPLREACARLELPFWLRKLPPGAFNSPLVNPPSEPQLVNRLISLVPQTPAAAAAWLERVLVAHHAGLQIGRPELALWVAQQYRSAQPSARSMSFLGPLAWAWFALSPDPSRGADLVSVRWSPSLGARRVGNEVRLWRERIALDVCLGPGLTDTWLTEGSVEGMSFVALRNADDFIAEARVMDNCLDRYADRLLGRAARVFSVRRDGRVLADIEIAPHEREPGYPVIAQLRGPHNRRAPLEVWRAAYAWLGSQPLRLADKSLQIKVGAKTRARREAAIWQPFIEALPLQGREAFAAILFGKPGRPPHVRRSLRATGVSS